ncbi:hypothetical protein OSB04_un001755 [Centaurea solstitialis]|uniref:Uncharacterized protein n=1 Tax=Centaurea solstitialis TaxID=347529 RepID=A0AA38SLA8_9ASTR|nr:hypothetical protein OSB04_un001755 [Centaurea solstitialis]
MMLSWYLVITDFTASGPELYCKLFLREFTRPYGLTLVFQNLKSFQEKIEQQEARKSFICRCYEHNSTLDEIRETTGYLKSVFEMKDLGKTRFLSYRIEFVEY